MTVNTPFSKWINPATARVRIYLNQLPAHRYKGVWAEQIPGSDRIAVRSDPKDSGTEWSAFVTGVEAYLSEKNISTWSGLHQAASGEKQTFASTSTPALRRLLAKQKEIPVEATTSLSRQAVIDILNGKTEFSFTPAKEQSNPAAPSIDRTEIEKIAGAVFDEKIKSVEFPDQRPIQIVIDRGEKNREIRNVEGKSHKCLSQVLRIVRAGLPVFLVGPAGSGKTTLAEQTAEALGLKFTFNSMTAGVSESSLLGRMLPQSDGNWKYQPAPFVETYKDGGLHLFDEMDAADPNMLLIVNSAIANNWLSVPFAGVKPYKKHSDTVIIGAANTYGTGASREYVGRNAFDVATLDRFAVSTVLVGYDTDLEYSLASAILADQQDLSSLLQWATTTRRAIDKSGIRRIMSTRTIVNTAKFMAKGGSLTEAMASYFSGWSVDELAKVRLA